MFTDLANNTSAGSVQYPRRSLDVVGNRPGTLRSALQGLFRNTAGSNDDDAAESVELTDAWFEGLLRELDNAENRLSTRRRPKRVPPRMSA